MASAIFKLAGLATACLLSACASERVPFVVGVEEEAMVKAIPAAAVADRPAPPERRGAPPPAGTIWDVAGQRSISPEMLRDRLGRADLVVLGAVQDNALHHARHSWLIAGLDPVGVAFQTVPEASERGIAAFRDGGGAAAEIGPAIGWSRLGWPDWALYVPVFEASANAVITGGRQSRAAIVGAERQGAAPVYGPRADAVGLSAALPEDALQALERSASATRCGPIPAEQRRGLIEAERLRNARFADALLRARARGIVARGTGSGMNAVERPERAPRTPVRAVLMTANRYARTDIGVPTYLARLAPALEVRVLGQVETAEGAPRPDDYAEALPYDYVWFSAPVEGRADPCAGLASG
ncbi:MAG: ChaN family lipoprotein [Pseudomonadota bacterium]